jgi:hypothetical protein
VPVLRHLPADIKPDIDGAVALVEEKYAAALDAIADGPAKTQGMGIGHAAAYAILAQRADDGSDTVFLDMDYPQGTAPGEFRFVENAPFAVAPLWGEVTPFVMRAGSQFRPGPPYDVTSAEYAADLNEVKELGRLGKDNAPTSRTAEQTQIALFWFESSPLRWNRIARTVSEAAVLDMWANARLFGLLNLALADGYIGNWDSKHNYNFWRPETAIRLADTDNNPATVADREWLPLWGSTGATPEYDSGHAIEGSAAAVVLERFFGSDDVTFSVCSYTLPSGTCTDASPTLREYNSYSQAANENGLSRILVGWHFRKAVDEGLEHGQKIGERTVSRYLRPVYQTR